MVKKISDKRKIAKQRRIKKRKEVQARHTHKQYKGVGKGCFAIHLANFVKKGGKKKKKKHLHRTVNEKQQSSYMNIYF